METTNERILKRIEYWEQNKKEDLIKTFPPRVQNFLKDWQVPLAEYPAKSSYLYGEARTGKTIELYKRIMIWQKTQMANQGSLDFLFVTNMNLITSVQEMMDKPEERSKLIDKYKKVRLLVIDDLGCIKFTDWNYALFQDIIDYRYQYLLTTFYSSNYSIKDYTEVTNDLRGGTRIAHDCGENIFEFTKPYI